MSRFRRKPKGKRTTSFFLILSLLLIGAGGYVFVTYFEGKKPLIEAANLPLYLGKQTPISIKFSDRQSGLQSLRVKVVQGTSEKEVITKTFTRNGKQVPAGPTEYTLHVQLDLKKLGLQEGEASLLVEARDYSLRSFLKGNSSELRHTVTVDTKPPKIRIIHSERYIRPGGAGIVIYQTEDSVKHGVMLNDRFHPGFPLIDESESKYIAYIGLPYSAREIKQSVIVAEDAAGNRSRMGFSPVLNKPDQKKDRINVGDGFLSQKVPEFEERYPDMEGDNLQKYIFANKKIRQMNNRKISELCLNPEEKQLWSGHFVRMAGSGRAGFADHRTYYYKGKEIDRQVHLGMDIASTKRAQIKAAGTGKVVFADYLGIYGNMVMIDHGQGIFSLYSHLSQINAAVDDMLNKGDIIGNSGTTGMAGGDHLHFSMLVNGVFVNPKEWWDPQWIAVTIDGPVVDAKF